jgi:hypothetical protein
MAEGGPVRDLFSEMEVVIAEMAGEHSLAAARAALVSAVTALSDATGHLEGKVAAGSYDDALAGATPYLKMFGTVVGGWLMARSALEALRGIEAGDDEAFLRSKLVTADFYCTQLLPQAHGLLAAVTADADPLFALSPEMLARS